MKKIVLFLSLVFSLTLSAQEGPRKVFCELLGTGKFMSSKVTVRIDFGQKNNFFTQSTDNRLVDEQGKAIAFNSMVDAMNFMGNLGWDFKQAYVVTTGQQNVYHWLLSKEVTSDDEITEGFTIKGDLKKDD